MRKWIICVARRLGKIATGLARLLPPFYTKSSPTSAGVLYTPAFSGLIVIWFSILSARS